MECLDAPLNAKEKMDAKIFQDRDFCVKVVNFQDRSEVKKFLENNDIEVNDDNINCLAEKISRASKICSELNDEEISKISGGKMSEAAQLAAMFGMGITAEVLMLGTLVLVVRDAEKRNWWKH